jgi:hypothetical protein
MSDVVKTPVVRKSRKLQAEIDITIEKINSIVRHIKNVQDNCFLLGNRLIETGEIELGKQLIANSLRHDNSKFFGTEWDNMTTVNEGLDADPNKIKRNLSISHHQRTNFHHPESWAHGIKEMPAVFVAEMVADWKSRSEEFATNLREWIESYATKKWKFDESDQIYKDIFKYVDMLCEKPFEPIPRSTEK